MLTHSTLHVSHSIKLKNETHACANADREQMELKQPRSASIARNKIIFN